MKSLKAWRHLRMMTLRDLAEQSGLSTKTINDAERGQTTPTFTTMRRVAEALQVEPAEVEEFAKVMGITEEDSANV